MAERDADITEELTELFKTGYPERNIHLTFVYNNKKYSLNFVSESTEYIVKLYNECVNLEYYRESEKISSMISANSAEKKCFQPILLTNARNKLGPRTKNIDVLQVLKSKLALCLLSEGIKVQLYDAARSGFVGLSSFSIMRGGDGVYEKYGYSSEPINEFKKKIPKLTFDQLNPSTQKDIERVYLEYLPEEPLLYDGSVMEILQKIPFEVENKTIISEKVFNSMIEDAGYDTEEKVVTYYLDTESSAWKEWNQKLLFTDIEIVETPPPAVAPPPISISAPPLLPIKKRIASMKRVIELAETTEGFRKQLPRYREILKELEAERNAQEGGSRRRRRRPRQTKKNRRHK